MDSVEGPMPQTRFVLKKALEFGLAVVVVVNKIDRPSARPDFVINSTFELFIELNATDEQVLLYILEGMTSMLLICHVPSKHCLYQIGPTFLHLISECVKSFKIVGTILKYYRK